MNTIKFNNYKILNDTLEIINFKSKTIINTINPHSYCVAKKDNSFQNSLLNSDILIPDGVGIVWATKFLSGTKIKRITGSDLHHFLLNKAGEYGLKVFYMGASTTTLFKIKNNIESEYPSIRFKSFSPPFKSVFSQEENSDILNAINSFQPDILFVGMTAPKQEKWVYTHNKHINAKIICSIGAVFDFYSGTVKRAPSWMRKFGLEWLHRCLNSPIRLGRRVLLSNPEFIWDILNAKLKSNNV